MTRREILAATAVLALVIALLPHVGGDILWTRPLWFDELCCVAYVVGDAASPAEVVRRVAHSWDYAPPLLHLIVWPFAWVANGDVTPVLLRSLSVTAVAAALLLVYATLRRRFPVFPSAGGAVAVAGSPLVLTHAFEGRFYGFWLLFAAGYAWSLAVRSDRPRDVAQAIFAVLLVAIHWFGIFSLLLMSAGALAASPGTLRARLRHVAWSLSGIVAALALAPMAIAQRTGAVGYLWLPELHAGQILELGQLFWVAAAPVAAILVLAGRLLRNAPPAPGVRSALRDPGFAAMVSLALMPVVLIGISALIQPSMLDRYAIVTVIAWAPVVALALTSLNAPARFAAAAGLGLILLLSGQQVISARRDWAADVGALTRAYEDAKTRKLPIVFWGLHSIYPVAGPVSQRTRHSLARYLDLPDSSLAVLFPGDAMEAVRKKYRLDRDQARGHARTYGFPVLATQSQLDSMRFVLLSAEMSLPGGYKRPESFGRALFPRHLVSRINGMLSLFERRYR